MTTVSEMQAAIEKSLVNMDRLDRVVNGDDFTTVSTDAGSVKSVAKLQSDLIAQVVDGLGTASVDSIVGLRDALYAIEAGTSKYTWVAWADSADGTVNFSNSTPGTRAYIGLAYNKVVQTPGTDPTAYLWTRIRGQDGINGTNGINGINGSNGLNNATVYLYKRSATLPAVPTVNSTYTFSTGVLTGHDNGWSQSFPSGSNPLYVTVATASSSSNTDTIASNEWAAPVLLVDAASSGLSVATVFLYKRAASLPAVPSVASTYTFATATLSGHNNGWTQTIPSGTQPIYITTATAVSTSSTDVINSEEWATPVILAQNGADGAQGLPGTNGTNGADGQTLFTWIAYSDSPNGSLNFTTGAPGGRAFIGIAYNKTSATESSNPSDYEWSAYAGPPAFGLVGNANVTIAGAKIYKTANGGDWNAQVYSSESFAGGAAVSFKVESISSVFVGLNTDPTTNASYDSIDYAIYLAGTSVEVRNNGATVLSSGTVTASVGDVFAIQYNGKRVSYTKNGVEFWSQTASANLRLWLDSSFADVSSQPHISIVSWTAVGAAGADGTNGTNGTNGANGVNGVDAISIQTTLKAVVVPAYADGTVTSFAPASGQAIVRSGATDVTGSASMSASGSNCTVEFNSVANSPVAGQPKGYYRVTAMSADTASVTITATYGGVTITEIVSITKQKFGIEFGSALPSTNLFSGRLFYLTSNSKVYRYTGTTWTVEVDGADILAGSITAAKIFVTQLSALSADVGLLRTASSGARTEIQANQRRVYNASNVMILRDGVW